MNELGFDIKTLVDRSHPNSKSIMKQASKPQPKALWSIGFQNDDAMYEWFIDCYRMRCDDDNQYGTNWNHGIFAINKTKLSIGKDFLIFCKLAQFRGIIPVLNWNWNRVLKKLLNTKFTKQDAIRKYGSENYFSAQPGGG